MNRFVLNNQHLGKVVYTTKNLVVQEIQSGKTRTRCYLIGNGHSLSIDNKNRVVKHDPLMQEFTPGVNQKYAVYAFYFTFECSGLEESSKELAEFVNNSLQEKYEEVVLVGHSKCGVCLVNTSRYCKKEVVLVTISTPHKGTIIADKEQAEEILNNPLLIKIYNMIFSDHNVDKDIAPNSAFIKNMSQPVSKRHINIVSSLNKISHCRNIIDILLMFLDNIMKIDGDGVVPLSSQEATSSNETKRIFCSHASSLEVGIEALNKLLF